MRIVPLLVLAPLAAAAAPAANVAPYDFQGVAIGAAQADIAAKYPGLRCSANDAGTECTRDADLSGRTLHVYYDFAAGRLYKIGIFFPYAVANEVTDGLTGRWGKPTPLIGFSVWTRGRYKILLKHPVPGGLAWATISDTAEVGRLQQQKERTAATKF